MANTTHSPNCQCFVIISGEIKMSIGCHQKITIPGTISTVLGMQDIGKTHKIMRTDIIQKKQITS